MVQQIELIKTEGVTLTFDDEALLQKESEETVLEKLDRYLPQIPSSVMSRTFVVNFMFTLLGAMVILVIYDKGVEPLLIRGIRSSSFGKTQGTSAADIYYSDPTRRLSAGCSKFGDADACNASTDKLGNSCVWCTNESYHRGLCVGDNSMGYKFAPCNNWLCHNPDEPSKSDPKSCERF